MDGLWLVLLGFGTGAYGVLVGSGGGFILAPILLLFFGMEAQTAVGTSLALVAVSSLSGGLAYQRYRLVDRRSALLFAAAAVPGSVLAPFILNQVGGSTFRVLFGLLLTGLAIYMLVRPGPPSPSRKVHRSAPSALVRSRHIVASDGQVFDYEFNEPLATSLNFILGYVSSFFGTGGGFLRTPILVSAFGFPVRVAVATSIFALMFYSTAGAITHASLGHVEWYPTFVWAGIGLIASAQLGARIATRLRGVWILRLLIVLLLGLGVWLIVQAFQG